LRCLLPAPFGVHLFHSTATGKHAVGIILTGMGADGAQGQKQMKLAAAGAIIASLS